MAAAHRAHSVLRNLVEDLRWALLPCATLVVVYLATFAWDEHVLQKAAASVQELSETRDATTTQLILARNREIGVDFARRLFRPHLYLERLYASWGLPAPLSELIPLDDTLHERTIEEQAKYADFITRVMVKEREALERQLRHAQEDTQKHRSQLNACSIGNAAYVALNCPFEDLKEEARRVYALVIDAKRAELADRRLQESATAAATSSSL